MLLYSKLWASTCKVKKLSITKPRRGTTQGGIYRQKRRFQPPNQYKSVNKKYIYMCILHCALLQNNLFFGNKVSFQIFLNFAASFPNLCLPAQFPNNSPCVFPLPQLLAWWAAIAELQRKDHPCDYRWDLSTASHAMGYPVPSSNLTVCY